MGEQPQVEAQENEQDIGLDDDDDDLFDGIDDDEAGGGGSGSGGMTGSSHGAPFSATGHDGGGGSSGGAHAPVGAGAHSGHSGTDSGSGGMTGSSHGAPFSAVGTGGVTHSSASDPNPISAAQAAEFLQALQAESTPEFDHAMHVLKEVFVHQFEHHVDHTGTATGLGLVPESVRAELLRIAGLPSGDGA